MYTKNDDPKPPSLTHYRKLSSDELLKETRAAVANERAIQAEVIRLLAEIDRRRLYASLGFRSLFDFCVRELRYSESAAWRRISAMRLIKDLPNAEAKLVTGELSLKTLTSVQNFLNTEERQLNRNFTLEQKKQILQSVENKSGRETEAILAALSPIPSSPHERERSLNGVDVEIRFVADAPLVGKLHRLKDLNSHRDPSKSYRGLFDWLTDLGLKTADPLTKSAPTQKVSKSPQQSQDLASRSSQGMANTRYIPTDLRIKIWKRDQGRCTYTDTKSGRRCDATSFIEIDHIVPHALGGENSLDNLRLYCRTHNLEAARKTYGAGKIAAEIRSSGRSDTTSGYKSANSSDLLNSDGNREPAPASERGAPSQDQSSA